MSGFTFGAQTSAPSFGASSTPQFSFGTSQPSTGFQLGGTTTSTAGGFNFKPTAAATPTPSLGVGGINPASTGGLNFGGIQTSTTATTGLSLNTTGTNLFGGTTSAAPTLNFGAPATSATPTLNFGAPATGSTGLSFGTPATTSAAASFSSSPLIGFGLPTSSAPSATTGFNLSGISTPVSSAPAEKIGLGGIPTTSQSVPGTQQPKEIPPKEQPIPNEILQDIETFKNFIKQQKLYSSDVARCSVKDFKAVEKEIEQLNNSLKEIETQLRRNRALTEKLKYDSAEGLQWLEMAQRTQDTPAGLQFDNTTPTNFFISLADRFEKDMHALKMQIESTDKYLRNCGQPVNLTSQDLCNGMKRLHDTFVALAGRLHSVHAQVESQKDMFLNLRKHLTNDPTNPFEKIEQSSMKSFTETKNKAVLLPHQKISCGPTPFNAISNGIRFPVAAQQSPIKISSSVGTSTAGFSFGTSNAPATTSLFGNTSTFSLGNSSFQLQKPPIGNKRKQ